MTILVTGAAGFIGFHLCNRLLNEKIPTIGFDDFNEYYDVGLKKARYEKLKAKSIETETSFSMVEGKLDSATHINELFNRENPKIVINLAAQAGVRYSLEQPSAYIQSNLVGFGNILEACRNNNVDHLIYASSSSVYGGNTNVPFKESQNVDHPVSLYAATKKANELMAHTYSHLYGLPTTGLRFFTVYGPWGRPDMALSIFTKAILANQPINVFNEGNMIRDFTYIDDITESLFRIINKIPKKSSTFDLSNPDPSSSWAPYLIFNIGNSQPTSLLKYIEAIEDALGIKAKKYMCPMQPGDVATTSADTSALERWTDFKPNTPLKEGVKSFVNWYRSYYQI